MDKEELRTIISELKESEDENIRKGIIKYLEQSQFGEEHYCVDDDVVRDYIDWLEKQGEHANFLSKIQVGDKVTRNEDGVLVNISQLNRVAKKRKKQGEQKPAWSEEDERNLNDAILFIKTGTYSLDKDNLINWLKSIKDRVQPKQEWSEEDEEIVEALNDYVKNLDILFSEIKIDYKDILSKEFREKVQLWLKSLKNRVQLINLV